MRAPGRIAASLAVVLALGSTATAQAPVPRVIDVLAERFEFRPSEIRVEAGAPVQLRVSSDDTMHGFRIVGGGVSLLVPKRGRGPVTVSLPALAPGRYTIECNRMCGAGHAFMRATLVVRPAGASR